MLGPLHVVFSLALTTFRFLCATRVAHNVIDDNECYDLSSLTGVPELWQSSTCHGTSASFPFERTW